MYETFKKNWDKNKQYLLSGIIIGFFLLLAVVYKSDDRIIKKTDELSNLDKSSELKILKKFLFDQLKISYQLFLY